jgi:hypothetical protein
MRLYQPGNWDMVASFSILLRFIGHWQIAGTTRLQSLLGIPLRQFNKPETECGRLV